MTPKTLYVGTVCLGALLQAACSSSSDQGVRRSELAAGADSRSATPESNANRSTAPHDPGAESMGTGSDGEPGNQAARKSPAVTRPDGTTISTRNFQYWGYDNAVNRCLAPGDLDAAADPAEIEERKKYLLAVAPDDAGRNGKKYPLFLYFTGTTFAGNSFSHDTSSYDSSTVQTVLDAMAHDSDDSDDVDDSYYAISVEYYNWVPWDHASDGQYWKINENIGCIYGSARDKNPPHDSVEMNSGLHSALGVACSLPGVDCSRITVWGFSQGAYMAEWAYDYNSSERQVKATWLTGFSTLPSACAEHACDDAKNQTGCTRASACDRAELCRNDPVGCWDWPAIPHDRLRLVNGADDSGNADRNKLNLLTKNEGERCDPTYGHGCMDQEGGGWYLVQGWELGEQTQPNGGRQSKPRVASHCWFDHEVDCNGKISFSPNWIQDTGTLFEFSLPESARWLKRRAARD